MNGIDWAGVQNIFDQMANLLDALGLLSVVQVAIGAVLLVAATTSAISWLRR